MKKTLIKLFIIFIFQFVLINSLFAEVFVISRATANIRELSTTDSTILEQADKDDWFIYLGNSNDNKWRNIELPDGNTGWIYYTLGRIQENYTPPVVTDATFEIDQLEIHIINVEQGDCTLIVAIGTGGEKTALLFDAGKPGKGDKYIVPYLKSIDISELKYIVLSHHDGDHLGGLDEVLKYTPGMDDHQITLTGNAYQPAGEPESSQKAQYDQYAYAVSAQNGREVLTLKPPEYLNLANGLSIQTVTGGGLYIDSETGNIIDLEPDSANAKSIGLLLTFNKFKFFVGGDMGGLSDQKKIENKVAPYIGDLDVLRANHHGANTSTHDPFVQITKPEVVLISCGSNNYGHPRQKVIDRLKAENTNVQIY